MPFGFKAFGSEQGLTSTTITAIMQDLSGFLWVGTEDGLFRLEGGKFRRFGTEEGLPANGITGLSFSRPSGLWVVTDKGVAWWDGRAFRRPGGLGFEGLDESSGLPLSNGGLILSTRDGEQRFFSATDGNGFQELKGLPRGGGAYCAFYNPDRNLLAVSLQEGLWLWDGKRWKSRVLFEDEALRKAVYSLHLDRKGRYWLRQTDGLFRLDSFEAAPVRVPTPEPLSVISDTFLAEDELGRIWTNTARSLIWVSDSGSGVLGERQGLPPGASYVFHIDMQGTLWAGGDGVFKLLGNFLWTSATRKTGLPADITWSVRRTRDGRLWAGTGSGLACGTDRGWKVVPGTERFQIMSLFEDSEGILWVGHMIEGDRRAGLMRVLPGRFEARAVFPADSVPKGSVFSIDEGPEDSLWLGTTRSGLIRIFPGPAGVRAETTDIPGWAAAEAEIAKVEADGAGGLWVAGSLGLAHWDGVSWALLPRDVLADPSILSVLSLGPDEAWIAPENQKQLSRVVREGTLLRIAETLPPNHPLSQALTFGLERDRDGVIWVSTARGLLRWERDRVEKYGRNAGLPGEDCAQNALWISREGDVWAGLSVGLAHGEMGRRREPQLPPGVALLEALDGRDRPLQALLPQPLIPWKDSSMFFDYAPRGSEWTEGIGFQVRLVGLEDSWRNTDISEARYPKLDVGSYRFEVRAVSPTGEPGPVDSLAFQILAPWWRRWWALAVWAGLVVGLIGLVIRRRTTVLRRRNEFLEAMVEARTCELEQANEALREAVLIDPLTGLYNRRYLTMTMPEEEARLRRMFRNYFMKGVSPLNQNEDLILFLGDLDHFKAINDTHGHAVGDRMIQETARTLKSVCRTADTLVRWGGEEFILVARRSDREKARLIAAKLCQAVRDNGLALPDGRKISCTISIGFAPFPILDQHPEAFSWEDTLQLADQCLYQAKSAGRSGWVGVLASGPLHTPEYAPRLRSDLRGLIRESQVTVETSFPSGRVFT
jgi:diguanylate cyclase (GGDEF)-like protein